MNTFVVFLFLFSLIWAAVVEAFDRKAAVAEFMAKAETCKAETGAIDADIYDMIAKKPASSDEGRCLRACIMKKYGLMASNGKIIKDVAVKHAEMYTGGTSDKMKIVKEIVDACVELGVPNDYCEAADKYFNCFREQSKAHGLTDLEI